MTSSGLKIDVAKNPARIGSCNTSLETTSQPRGDFLRKKVYVKESTFAPPHRVKRCLPPVLSAFRKTDIFCSETRDRAVLALTSPHTQLRPRAKATWSPPWQIRLDVERTICRGYSSYLVHLFRPICVEQNSDVDRIGDLVFIRDMIEEK